MPKRYPEMIDVLLLVKDAAETAEVPFCINNFFAFQQKPDEAVELVSQGVRGIHLTAIDPIEQKRISNVINDSGKFTFEVKTIIPEEENKIPLIVIRVIHKGSASLVDQLIDLMKISNSICTDLRMHIPGF